MKQLNRRNKIYLTVLEASSVFLTVFLSQMITTVFPAYPSIQNQQLNSSKNSITNCSIEDPSNVYVGILIGFKYVTELIMFPVAGFLVDKYYPPRVLFYGVIIETMSCVIYSISGNFYSSIIARIVDAVGYSIVATAGLTILYSIYLKDRHRNKVITIDSILVYVATSVSPYAAGTVYESVSKNGHNPARIATFMPVCLLFLFLLVCLLPFVCYNSCISLYFSIEPDFKKDNEVEKHLSLEISDKNEIQSGNSTTNLSISSKTAHNYEELKINSENQSKKKNNEKENNIYSVSCTIDNDDDNNDNNNNSLSMMTLLKDPHVIIILLCLLFNSLIGNSLETTLPIFMIRKFCSDQTNQGIVWLFGFLSLFGFFLTSVIFHKKPQICWCLPIIGLISIGLLCICLNFCNPWWVIGICLGFMTFFSSITELLLIPIIPKIIDKKYSKIYGSGSGLTLLTFTISGIIGTFPVGVLVEHYSFLVLCIILCICNVILAPLLVFLKKFFY